MKRFFDYTLSLIFSLAVLVAGIALVAWDIGKLQQARNSCNWPTAQGQVTQSDLEMGRSDITPRISYTYATGGRQYRSKQISFDLFDKPGGRGLVQDILDRYPVGKTVAVDCDPEQPATSVLEPGDCSPFLLPLIFAEIALFGGAWTLYLTIRQIAFGPKVFSRVVSKRRLIATAAIMSKLLYQLIAVVSFQSDVRVKQVQAFGELPFGMPNLVFVLLLQTLLYLPVPWFLWHTMRLAFQSGERVSWFWIVNMLFSRYDDPDCRWSQKVCIGGLVYVVVLLFSWIAYAAALGYDGSRHC